MSKTKKVETKPKTRTLYFTVQPETENNNMYSQLFVGRPKLSTEKCSDCGCKHPAWVAQKGSRVIMDDLCDAATSALGVSKKEFGAYKLTVIVEPVD